MHLLSSPLLQLCYCFVISLLSRTLKVVFSVLFCIMIRCLHIVAELLMPDLRNMIAVSLQKKAEPTNPGSAFLKMKISVLYCSYLAIILFTMYM